MLKWDVNYNLELKNLLDDNDSDYDVVEAADDDPTERVEVAKRFAELRQAVAFKIRIHIFIIIHENQIRMICVKKNPARAGSLDDEFR